MTSMVLMDKRSVLSEALDVGAGRKRVGPNTVAKLCSDILFWTSLLLTLFGRKEKRKKIIKS